MKALSIKQPWAWLIVNRFKDIENRDWQTKVRGRILVHAGQKIDEFGYRWVRARFTDIVLPEKFEVGGFVGSVEISDCVSESESEWFAGDYGFVLKNAIAFDQLMPYRGQLGFFNPLGDYSLRNCRGSHWHVTVGEGEEQSDLMLDGDPYRTMREAVEAALSHKKEMDEARDRQVESERRRIRKVARMARGLR